MAVMSTATEDPAAGLDATVAELERRYRALPFDDPARDEVAVALIDARWERYWFHAYHDDGDRAQAGDCLNRLIASQRALVLRQDDAHLRMTVGLGHLERFHRTGSNADLDTGISLISGAMNTVQDARPIRTLAAAELSRAHRLRGERDEDHKRLNRAIGVANEAIADAGADDPWWLLLHEYQADNFLCRARHTRDPYDLDLALHHARMVGVAHTVPILVERAHATGRADHVQAALESLQALIAEADDPHVRAAAQRQVVALRRD
jgi:hypothetical protein